MWLDLYGIFMDIREYFEGCVGDIIEYHMIGIRFARLLIIVFALRGYEAKYDMILMDIMIREYF